jgi:hypothetical protein
MTPEETDIAAAKHARRCKAFEAAGLSADAAYDLADKMFNRDEDIFDDRRLCFECRKYDTKTETCPKYVDFKGRPQIPPRFTLQRCDMFDLRGKR